MGLFSMIFGRWSARRSLPRKLYCPICKTTSNGFLTFGINPRKNAMCPHCRSLERHREFWLYLKHRTNFFEAQLSVLDVAPQPKMMELFSAMPNLRYEAIDLEPRPGHRVMDLTALEYEDNTFDWVICFHVLEHIPDDRRAMREILRVLKPGGIAALQSLVHHHMESTDEDISIEDPEERERRFGQRDHVRIYGRDYADRLREEGFVVEPIQYCEELGPDVARRCSLYLHRFLYLCRKPD